MGPDELGYAAGANGGVIGIGQAAVVAGVGVDAYGASYWHDQRCLSKGIMAFGVVTAALGAGQMILGASED